MSFQSDSAYTFKNVKGETAVDISGADNETVFGYAFHGQGNQQWVFDQSGSNWTIRSVATNKYLNFRGDPEDNVRIVATEDSREWDIRPDEQDSSVFRVFVPGTKYNMDLADHGNSANGTPITLWGTWAGANQTWRINPA